MGFQAPWLLLGLLLVPIGLWAYVRHARAERAAARLFTAEPVAASVVPRRPGWRRHAPPVLMSVGLAALLVALARPEATVAVPVEQASIVLLTDVSGSMQSTDVAPSRLIAARDAARKFAATVPAKIKLGVVAFNGTPTVLQAPTSDRVAVRDALDQLKSSGGTATGDALAAALKLLRPGTANQPPAAIVLLSDGKSVKGRDMVEVARAAKRRNVAVFTISLGTPTGTIQVKNPDGSMRTVTVPPDPASLRQVAQVSGGEAFATADARRLAAVYQHLGSKLSTEKQPRELTAGFAGAAMLFVLGGALLSLRWFGRLT